MPDERCAECGHPKAVHGSATGCHVTVTIDDGTGIAATFECVCREGDS